jgi:hypothetical protein
VSIPVVTALPWASVAQLKAGRAGCSQETQRRGASPVQAKVCGAKQMPNVFQQVAQHWVTQLPVWAKSPVPRKLTMAVNVDSLAIPTWFALAQE